MSDYFLRGLFGAWLSAEPATRFTAAGVFGLDNSLPAVLATLLEVCSFGCFLVGMAAPVRGVGRGIRILPGGRPCIDVAAPVEAQHAAA
jgi:hypothetical protein